MLGMWDMNDRNTIKMVAESIVTLERKVVYIIPFSQLKVDTRYLDVVVCVDIQALFILFFALLNVY